MAEAIKKQSAKKQKADLIKNVRDMTRPSRLKIPHKNPSLNYRWINKADENVDYMEFKGYRVANADEIRYAQLKPGVDGVCRRGDLILAVEPMSHHRDHKNADKELKKRQDMATRQGVRRNARAGGFNFDETIKQT